MEELAKRAVACEGWRWMPGMCSEPDTLGRVWRRNGCPSDAGFGFSQMSGRIFRAPCRSSELQPDLEDPATLGAIEGRLATLHQDDTIHCRCEDGVWTVESGRQPLPHGRGGSRQEALVVALEGVQ